MDLFIWLALTGLVVSAFLVGVKVGWKACIFAVHKALETEAKKKGTAA